MSSASLVKLKRKKPDSEHESAVIVRFPSGPPAQLLKPESASSLSFQLYNNADARKSSQRVLVCDAGAVAYGGKNFGDENFKNNTNKFCIGIYTPDKSSSSSSCKLIDIPHVFNLVPNLSSLISSHEDEEKDSTYASQMKVLADTFGSKKKQKQLQSRAANQVTVEESSAAVLQHAIANVEKNEQLEEEDVLLQQIHENILPPHNPAAEHARNIYDLNSIIPERVWNSLDVKNLKKVVKKPAELAKEEANFSAFVFRRLRTLEDQLDQQIDHAVHILKYIQYVLMFRGLPKNAKRRGMEAWECPQEVKEQLLHDFTETTQQGEYMKTSFNSRMSEKLLCWLSVLSLFACNFTVDATDIDNLTKDLKFTSSDLLRYFREAGCSGGKSQVRLTAPLSLPKLRKKNEKKKK